MEEKFIRNSMKGNYYAQLINEYYEYCNIQKDAHRGILNGKVPNTFPDKIYSEIFTEIYPKLWSGSSKYDNTSTKKMKKYVQNAKFENKRSRKLLNSLL